MTGAKWVTISEDALKNWIQGMKIALSLIPKDDARRVYPATDLKSMERVYEESFGVCDGRKEGSSERLVENGRDGDSGTDGLLRNRKSCGLGDSELTNFEKWKKGLKPTDPSLHAAMTSSCEVGCCPARNFCDQLHVPLPCKDRWDMWANSVQKDATLK